MFDGLIAMTALPNLHPAIVHFPIALSVVALLAALRRLSLEWLPDHERRR